MGGWLSEKDHPNAFFLSVLEGTNPFDDALHVNSKNLLCFQRKPYNPHSRTHAVSIPEIFTRCPGKRVQCRVFERRPSVPWLSLGLPGGNTSKIFSHRQQYVRKTFPHYKRNA